MARAPNIREARVGDGAELVRLWLDMADDLFALDAARFRRPAGDGFAAAIDERLGAARDDAAEFVADAEGHLVGFVVVRRLDSLPNAERQILRQAPIGVPSPRS